jgi:hypothetical protein
LESRAALVAEARTNSRDQRGNRGCIFLLRAPTSTPQGKVGREVPTMANLTTLRGGRHLPLESAPAAPVLVKRLWLPLETAGSAGLRPVSVARPVAGSATSCERSGRGAAALSPAAAALGTASAAPSGRLLWCTHLPHCAGSRAPGGRQHRTGPLTTAELCCGAGRGGRGRAQVSGTPIPDARGTGPRDLPAALWVHSAHDLDMHRTGPASLREAATRQRLLPFADV